MPTSKIFNKEKAKELYLTKGKSMQDVALYFNCSVHKVRYWFNKENVQIRSISDAIYLKKNPNGDPFCFREPECIEDSKLLGLGLGLYWGEGTKASKYSVRLGNTDPLLIAKFIQFLTRIFDINKKDLRFGLQLFSDIDQNEALKYWTKSLNINNIQFYKIITTKSGSLGTYRNKSRYGVLTVYYNNKKLRDAICNMLPT